MLKKGMILIGLLIGFFFAMGQDAQSIGNPHVQELVGNGKLNADKPADRSSAALVLHNMGVEAVEALPFLLDRLEIEEDLDVRRALVFTLGSLGRQLSVDKLGRVIEALIRASAEAPETDDFKRRFIRREAVKAMGLIGRRVKELRHAGFYQNMVQALERGLTDSCCMVGELSATALADIGSYRTLVSAAGNTTIPAEARRQAIWKLRSARNPSSRMIRVLIDNLSESNDGEVRYLSGETLGRLGKPAVPLLRKALSSVRPHVRWQAAKALGDIGPEAVAATGDLLKIVNDPNEQVSNRFMAVEGLGGIGPGAKEAVTHLIVILDNNAGEDRKVHWYAISSLGLIAGGLQDPVLKRKALSALARAWETSTDTDESERIAEAIGRFGVAGLEQARSLQMRVSPQEMTVARAVIRALAQMGPEAVPHLERLALTRGDHAEPLRTEALRALATIKNGKPERYRFIRNRLDDDRRSAMIALGELRDPRAIGDLAPHVNAYDEAARALVQVLKAIPEKVTAMTVADLEQVSVDLAKIQNREYVQEAVEAIDRELGNRSWKFIKDLVREPGPVRWILLAIAYFLFWSLIWGMVYLIRPLWIQKVCQVLNPLSVTSPWLGGMTISLGKLILVELYQYRERVIDHWVAGHLPDAREDFARKNQTETLVMPPIALENGKHLIPEPKFLQKEFRGNTPHLMVISPSADDRSQFVRTLTWWAMASCSNQQIFQQSVLPVIFDKPFTIETHDQFLELVRAKLRWRVNNGPPIPIGLFDQLLLKRRIMVLVENFTDLNEDTRSAILSSGADSPLNTLILTSDRVVSLNGRPFETIHLAETPRDALSQYVAWLNRSAEIGDYSDDDVLRDAGRVAGTLSDHMLRGETPTMAALTNPLGNGEDAAWKIHYFRQRLGIMMSGKEGATTFTSKTLLCYLAVYNALNWQTVNDAAVNSLVSGVVARLNEINDVAERRKAAEFALMVLDAIKHIAGHSEAVLPGTLSRIRHYFRHIGQWLATGEDQQPIIQEEHKSLTA